mmetsp:Transcript_21077/g.26052  ORF Transcript_21077/g.26052 Transcript_21077/m.26052 type:complete len:144 (+) Transcript_21077:117-548(+)
MGGAATTRHDTNNPSNLSNETHAKISAIDATLEDTMAALANYPSFGVTVAPCFSPTFAIESVYLDCFEDYVIKNSSWKNCVPSLTTTYDFMSNTKIFHLQSILMVIKVLIHYHYKITPITLPMGIFSCHSAPQNSLLNLCYPI